MLNIYFFQKKFIPFVYMEWSHIRSNNFGLCPNIERLIEVKFMREQSYSIFFFILLFVGLLIFSELVDDIKSRIKVLFCHIRAVSQNLNFCLHSMDFTSGLAYLPHPVGVFSPIIEYAKDILIITLYCCIKLYLSFILTFNILTGTDDRMSEAIS